MLSRFGWWEGYFGRCGVMQVNYSLHLLATRQEGKLHMYEGELHMYEGELHMCE